MPAQETWGTRKTSGARIGDQMYNCGNKGHQWGGIEITLLKICTSPNHDLSPIFKTRILQNFEYPKPGCGGLLRGGPLRPAGDRADRHGGGGGEDNDHVGGEDGICGFASSLAFRLPLFRWQRAQSTRARLWRLASTVQISGSSFWPWSSISVLWKPASSAQI